ncbi:DUF3592 domain-containing protein [uncultured Aquimarina sp.]|uniref:DUF3592 domain-containing protein n=1 Tax=uncultured Aquimarina sp. TaxID=575652 RepID=UPI002638AE46|nr:DUF3592 domain-containing protein [uncultured Aquimarina sp.]
MNKKILGLIAVLVVAIGILAFNTYYKKEALIKNGAVTTAVIAKISTNKIDNEFSPTVENIHIKYKYVINTKEYTKTQEISRHEHDLYFVKTGKIGDSVTITYDAKNPTNSKIEKINKK